MRSCRDRTGKPRVASTCCCHCLLFLLLIFFPLAQSKAPGSTVLESDKETATNTCWLREHLGGVWGGAAQILSELLEASSGESHSRGKPGKPAALLLSLARFC